MALSEDTLARLVVAIHDQRELKGCIIGLHAEQQSRLLHTGNARYRNYGRVIVIIEMTPPRALNWRIPTAVDKPVEISHPPEYVTNRSKLAPELIGAGLSCGLAVFSTAGAVAATGATASTVGATMPIMVASWVGAVTASIQCVNGLTRASEVIWHPEDNSLQRWDDNTLYTRAILLVDGVGVLASVVSLAPAVRGVFDVLAQHSGHFTVEQIMRMTKAQRLAATKQAVERTLKLPGGREALKRAMQASGLRPGKAEKLIVHGAVKADKTATLINAARPLMRREAFLRLVGSIRNLLSTKWPELAGIAASATPANLTGSASGSVNALFVHIMNRDPN